MSKPYDDDVLKWIQSLTTGDWVSELPKHCLSSTYQDLGDEAVPFSGVPKFASFEIYSLGNFETRNMGGHDRAEDLVLQTWNRYVAMQEDSVVRELREEITSLEQEVQNLATIIDRNFKTVRNRSDEKVSQIRQSRKRLGSLAYVPNIAKRVETNIISETNRLIDYLSRKNSEDLNLRDLVSNDHNIQKCFWGISPSLSRSAFNAATRSKQEGTVPLAHELLFPFVRQSKRPCISLSDFGFEIGLDVLPADLTLQQAKLFLEFYREDKEKEADQIGPTHALMYLQCILAKAVYRRRLLYGTVGKWKTKGDIPQSMRPSKAINEGHLKDPEKACQAILDVLENRKPRHEAWRVKNGVRVPNASGIYRILVSTRPDSLMRKGRGSLSSIPPEKKDEALVSIQTVRKYVRQIEDERSQEVTSARQKVWGHG